MLPSTITEYQFAFVANRQILNVSLIANEIIDERFRKDKREVVIELDVEKPIYMVDLEDILNINGIGHKWRKWIRGCIV